MKNISPAPSVGAADGVPWLPRGTTYPASYILTDAPPPLPSSNVYRPSIECPSTQSWRVPDPYDCSAYHYCSGKFFKFIFRIPTLRDRQYFFLNTFSYYHRWCRQTIIL